MTTTIITKEDLELFEARIFQELKMIKEMIDSPQSAKKILKSSDVKMILGCSDSKLSGLRISGELPSTQVGGTHYYRQEDIDKLFNLN